MNNTHAGASPVERPVRPLPVVAWLASTPDGEYALALTEKGARKRAGDSADDVVPLTLHAAAVAEIERWRQALTDALEVGGHLMNADRYERARALRDGA
jgi:hypothetical protein